MQNTCADCRFCQDGYCQIYEKRVSPNAKACADFEET